MKKIISIMIVSVAITGCATSNKIQYSVASEPSNAQVDVNGVEMGSTPTEITLGCSKQWVGVMNAPGGWANASGAYEVKVYPPKGFNGQSQTKIVDPCQWAGEGTPALKFDLGLESVAPTQKIEIIHNSNPSKYDEAIRSLCLLRDQGVITEKEYQQKILKLTE